MHQTLFYFCDCHLQNRINVELSSKFSATLDVKRRAVLPRAVYSGDAYVSVNVTDLLPNFWSNHIRMTGYGGSGYVHALWLRMLLPSLIFALPWYFVRTTTCDVLFPRLARTLGIRGMTRARKFSYQLWLAIFYLGSTAFGVYVIWGQPYASSHGKGAYVHCWKRFFFVCSWKPCF